MNQVYRDCKRVFNVSSKKAFVVNGVGGLYTAQTKAINALCMGCCYTTVRPAN